MSDIEWTYTPEENGGEPMYLCELASDRDNWSWPGARVAYGKGQRGTWRVALILVGDAERFSDDMDGETDARSKAEALVRALRLLWPARGTDAR